MSEDWKILSSQERENSVALGACILYTDRGLNLGNIQEAVKLSLEIHAEVLKHSAKVNE